MVPTASGRICLNHTSTARSTNPDALPMAASSGLRKIATGTSTNQPSTAPQNRIAEMRSPTMKPTPMTIGDASGVDSSMPPE